MTYKKTCLNCGQEFETDHYKALYCCEKCGNTYRRKDIIKIILNIIKLKENKDEKKS